MVRSDLVGYEKGLNQLLSANKVPVAKESTLKAEPKTEPAPKLEAAPPIAKLVQAPKENLRGRDRLIHEFSKVIRKN